MIDQRMASLDALSKEPVFGEAVQGEVGLTKEIRARSSWRPEFLAAELLDWR